MRIVSRPLAVLRAPLEALGARHDVEVVSVDDAALLQHELADADALWLWPAFYDAALVDVLEANAARLRWLQLMTMGYDPVEHFGAPSGVTITSAGDSFAPTVAEHAVALLLALQRQIPAAIGAGSQRGWDASISGRVGTLVDARVTVVGFGNIGREIAVRLRACGARVTAVTRSGRADPLADEAAPLRDLHAVLQRSDAVVLALPLNSQSRHLIDAAALAVLPPHAVIVNIARGGVVDTAALNDALASGRLAGAGLDVTDPEPLPADHPLWRRPSAIITPHVAGYGGDVPGRRILALVERNLTNFIAGRELEARILLAPRTTQPLSP